MFKTLVFSIVLAKLLVTSEGKNSTTCPMSTVPENGGYRVFLLPAGHTDYLTSSQRLPVGAIILHYCDVGFAVAGEWKRHCMSNGEWNSTTPTCVLNMAPFSDLDQRFPPAVDGSMLTTPGVYNLFTDNKTAIIRTRGDFVLHKLRLFTEYHRIDNAMKVYVEAENRSFSRYFSNESTTMALVDIDDPPRYDFPLQMPKEEALRVHKIVLDLTQYRSYMNIPLWNPMELQLVSEVSGLSVARCEKDVHRKEEFSKSWAVDGSCFHLGSLEMSAEEAERFCSRQSLRSALLHLQSQLLQELIEAHLRYNHKNENRLWWIADALNYSTNESMKEKLEPDACLALSKHDDKFQISGVSCQLKGLPICQAPPLSCSSPRGVLERLRIGVDAFVHGTILRVHADGELKIIRCVLGEWEDHKPGVTLIDRLNEEALQMKAASNSWSIVALIVVLCVIISVLVFLARRRRVRRRRRTNHFM